MFFSLPGLAMKNIRSALKPGGKFTQVVWRKREDNPDVLVEPLVMRNGAFELPTKPGLGVELNKAVLQRAPRRARTRQKNYKEGIHLIRARETLG